MLKAYLDAYRGLPAAVWKVSIVLLVNRCGTMVLPFWALYCTSERGLTVGQAGTLLAVHGVGGIGGSVLGGLLSSRWGPVPVMIASLAFTSIAFFWLMVPTTMLGMASVMFLLSVFSESTRPAAATATAACCQRHLHPRAMGLNRLAINLGMAFGAMFGGFLASVSFELLFYCDAITCALASLASAYLLRGLPTELVEAEQAGGGTTRNALTDGVLWVVLGTMFLCAVVFFQLLGTYVLYLRDHYSLEEYQIGILMGVNTCVIVIAEMVLLRFVERFDQLLVIGCGCFFACLGFGMIRFGNTMSFAVASVLVWTLGEMLSAPMTAGFITARASVGKRGIYLGMFTGCFSIAAVAAPIWGTWMYDRDPDGLWNACLALAVVTFAVPWLLSRVLRRNAAGAEHVDRDTIAESAAVP